MEGREGRKGAVGVSNFDTTTEAAESTRPDGSAGAGVDKAIDIALSGGAARCAFQAGLLDFLIREGISFGNMYAISGGVINAYFVKSGRWEELREFWLDEMPAHANQFRWYAGIPFNVMSRKKGLISSEFVRILLDRYVREAPKGMYVDVISMFNGKQYTLSGKDFLSVEDFKDAMYASVAIPAVFPPVDIKTKAGPILDAADGGIYFPLPDVVAPWKITTHHYERDIERVKGPVSSLLRVNELRKYDRFENLFNEPGMINPFTPLPKAWDWKKDSLTYSFYHGQEVGQEYLDRINP